MIADLVGDGFDCLAERPIFPGLGPHHLLVETMDLYLIEDPLIGYAVWIDALYSPFVGAMAL